MDELHPQAAAGAERLHLLCLDSDAGASLIAIRFAGPLPGVLRAVALDTMTALYDRRSGQTHLVAAIVPDILDALADGPITLDSLAAHLDVSEATAILAERLAELAALGLVEAP